MAEARTEESRKVYRKSQPLVVEVAVRLVKEKPIGLIGALIIIVLFTVGILADFLAPYHWNDISLAARLQPPSGQYLLGTDNLGRDMLSRIIHGARISMIVGLSATIITVAGHTFLGIISGYMGGKIDLVLQRLNDAMESIPNLLLVLTVMAILGPGLWQVILAMALPSSLHSRGTRSWVFTIKENFYFEAARATGAPTWRILIYYVLPNILPMVILTFAVDLGRFILQEASLSFLGFGIPPPFPSWGGMLSGAGRQHMLQAPWMVMWPGLALFAVVYGANILGDALRDLLDPRLRGGLGRYGRG
ncbi:MAG: ABC transporter permease [Dehalococcoidales bacterium]|nr:ABC transporter permease [Dehalococcoidales bacterium]